jgi:hypothetical protein
MNLRRLPLWQDAKCSLNFSFICKIFHHVTLPLNLRVVEHTTQKCPEYRHPIHSIIGWSLMLDETHFFLWDRKYSLSFFRMKGLGADWLCHGYSMTKKHWTGYWEQDSAFTWNDWLNDWFHTRAGFSPLITFNHLQIYDIWYQRQTIRPSYMASPNSLLTSTVYRLHNVRRYIPECPYRCKSGKYGKKPKCLGTKVVPCGSLKLYPYAN